MSESKHIYIVYEITNLVNQKIYIGVHKQYSGFGPFEFYGYLGSSESLDNDIKKYDKKNFSRMTLFVYDSPEEASDKEEELVNAEFVARNDTYNIAIGGRGYLKSPRHINVKDENGKIFRVHVEDPRYVSGELKQANIGVIRSKEYGAYMTERNNKYWSNPNNKAKASKTQQKIILSVPPVTCEYCLKEMNQMNYKKWHGVKCKDNPNLDPSSRLTEMFTCETCGKQFNAENFKKHKCKNKK